MMIFFDLDDTLLDHGYAQRTASGKFFEHFAERLPYAREQFQPAWTVILERHFERFARGEISFAEMRQSRIREVFADPAMEDEEAEARFNVYLRNYEANWRLFDDVLPCLERLNHHGIGIITNGNHLQQHQKLERIGLAGRFSTVVISEEVGLGKPDMGIFLEGCRRAGVQPAECVYVGDHWHNDVLGSRAAGMRAVWLNRKKLPVPDSAVPVIESLGELDPSLSALIGG